MSKMRKLLGVAVWFATMLTVAFFFIVNVILVSDNTGAIGKNIINLKIKDREVFNYELFEEGIRDWIDSNKDISSFKSFIEAMNGSCLIGANNKYKCKIPVFYTICYAQWAELDVLQDENTNEIITIIFRKKSDGC